jgi:hypothetical protein
VELQRERDPELRQRLPPDRPDLREGVLVGAAPLALEARQRVPSEARRDREGEDREQRRAAPRRQPPRAAAGARRRPQVDGDVERARRQQDQRVVLEQERREEDDREQQRTARHGRVVAGREPVRERHGDDEERREPGVGVGRPRLVGDERPERREPEQRSARMRPLRPGQQRLREERHGRHVGERTEQRRDAQPVVRAEPCDERRREEREADRLVVREARVGDDRTRVVAGRGHVPGGARVDEPVAHQRLTEPDREPRDRQGEQDPDVHPRATHGRKLRRGASSVPLLCRACRSASPR